MKRFLIFLLLINAVAVAQPWLPSGTVPQQIKGDGTSTPPAPPPTGPGWQRPADWLPLPEIAEGDQRMVALFAVWPSIDNNIADIKVTCGTGYTVDWGDGSVDNYYSTNVADHLYDYDSLPAGSYCSEGYKTVVVQVYPQETGDITGIAFGNSVIGLGTNAKRCFLDVLIQCSKLNTLEIYGRIMARQFALRKNSLEYMNYLFTGCQSLVSVPELDVDGTVDLGYLFDGCTALLHVSISCMTSVTSASRMFYGCKSLIGVTVQGTNNIESISDAFNGCTSLVSISGLDMSSAQSTYGAFSQCDSLSKVSAQGAIYSLDFAYCNLSASAIDRLFTDLGTAADGYTAITVTGNPGAATCDDSIATAKGWQVNK